MVVINTMFSCLAENPKMIINLILQTRKLRKTGSIWPADILTAYERQSRDLQAQAQLQHLWDPVKMKMWGSLIQKWLRISKHNSRAANQTQGLSKSHTHKADPVPVSQWSSPVDSNLCWILSFLSFPLSWFQLSTAHTCQLHQPLNCFFWVSVLPLTTHQPIR